VGEHVVRWGQELACPYLKGWKRPGRTSGCRWGLGAVDHSPLRVSCSLPPTLVAIAAYMARRSALSQWSDYSNSTPFSTIGRWMR
jgi:hypothetical protein